MVSITPVNWLTPIRLSILGGAPGHGPDPQMKVVSIHSLSELERLKLQETAYQELRAKHFLSGFKPNRAVTTDRPNTLENSFLVLRGQDGALSSLQTFGVRLEEVLVNEFTRRKHLELTAAMQVEEANREAIGGGPRRRRNIMQRMLGRVRLFFNRPRNEPALPREFTRRGRRGAMSVDSLAELEDGSLLLEALQLSRASFPMGERLWGSKTEMSLNPIAKQIPQVVETCCRFIEEHGLSAVGIFTMERSAEKVRQLREEFDQGLDVVLDENQNVYDVAVVLKEFFRDMQDSLLPDDLRKSFLLTATLKPQDQLAALQLLVSLLPPCHSDSLERLLKVLHKITEYSEDSIDLDGQVVKIPGKGYQGLQEGMCVKVYEWVPGNRMTSTNLALVFGSVLLKEEKPVKRESRKTQLRTDHYVASVNVVHAMIDNWDVLFQVPPHIQRQVAKRVWNSSPEALDFIRRRNLRKIQSARIKMEEDALVSDPVDSPAEARAAVLGQSRPFDEGHFHTGGHALDTDQSFSEGQALPLGQVLAEYRPREDDESSEKDPKGVPDVQETLDAGENLNYDFEEGPNYEDQQNVNLAEVPYLDVIPNNEDSSDTEEISDAQEDQLYAFENDEVSTVTPDTEDVSILNTVPDSPQDLAVNLEVINVEDVPMPKDVDPKEVQNPKATQFLKEDADVASPVDTTLLKNKSQSGQVMSYRFSLDSLISNPCFFPWTQYCSFEDPVVLPGAVQSYDDEEGSGNLPIPEQKSPIFRVPRKKKAKTVILFL
ncbi:hypothetical protein GW7_12767 [Heterocephalus glaber]|uniref:Rho-GAP domain-containing protein n=1 Tax=Heterocephalus glaber TaxID=10181 RepID=G5BC50_HETGA|nr:hypothetical protein GW7_12767 [Heterocephalus glaber]